MNENCNCIVCSAERKKILKNETIQSITKCYYCGASEVIGNTTRCPLNKDKHKINCPERIS